MFQVMAKKLVRLMSSPAFEQLSVRQRMAVTQALSLTVVPVGRGADSNRLALRRELLGLPWAARACCHRTDGLDSRPECRLMRVHAITRLEALASTLAVSLESAALKDHTFSAMVVLAFADGAQLHEVVLLEPIRLRLSVRTTRAGEIVDELNEESVSPVF
jgi:hypothetical protein